MKSQMTPDGDCTVDFSGMSSVARIPFNDGCTPDVDSADSDLVRDWQSGPIKSGCCHLWQFGAASRELPGHLRDVHFQKVTT
jgi:hypothetical protein